MTTMNDSGTAAVPARPAAAPASVAAGGKSAARRSGLALVLLGALLAFLLASTPARDGELWSRLAAGRALAAGRFPSTPSSLLDAPADTRYRGVYWLRDAPLYGGYRLLGGPGLVALNASLAALLAVLIFMAARSGESPTIAGVMTLLATVALAPWLGLIPGLLPYLFLALSLLLVRRVALAAEGERGRARAAWFLPVLIVVWANVDGSVVLGPLAVGLSALGQWLCRRVRAARALGGLFVAGLAASLLSPNHVHAWNLTEVWPSDSSAQGFSLAWFHSVPFATALAYATLIALGLVAFASDWRGRAWTWAPLWLVLLGLGIWHREGAPFFAIVAAPVGAVGLAVLIRRRVVAEGGRWARTGRQLAALAGMLLVLAAWPGWLQGQPYGRRTWSAEPDESLRDAVELISGWHRAGALGAGGRSLALSPEVADYWAWFGPREVGPSDARSGLSAADLAILKEGLLGTASNESDWRGFLRARQVNYLILHNSAAQPVAPIVKQLSAAPEEWRLVSLRGRTVVFGWLDPSKPGAYDPMTPSGLNLDRRAFHPASADRAPPERPGRGPARWRWWEAFVEPPPQDPAERDEAGLYLVCFDAQRPRYQQQSRMAWHGAASAALAPSLAASALGAGPLAADLAFRLTGIEAGWEFYAAAGDDGPPGHLLLAVRAARRAVRAAPDDARSYLVLGEAYLRLAEATRERGWFPSLPAFDRIRQAQAASAFRHALVLQPNSVQAHGRLARLYRMRGSLDLTLRHLTALLDASRARGPQAGETIAVFRANLAPLEEEQRELEQEVRRSESAWKEGTRNRKVLDVARDAAARGLHGHALETLLKSDASEFGPEGMRLELDLLLWEGRVGEVREWLGAELEDSLGAASYHELRARLAAATGDYDEAGRELTAVAAALRRGPGRARTPDAQAAYDVARAALEAPFLERNPAALAETTLARLAMLEEVREIAADLRREADAHVVRGLLALEGGNVEEAEAAFRLALRVWKNPAAAAAGNGLDFAGRPIAEECLRLIGPYAGG
jgi:tetratricopeptide (TPR) repeat protein